MFDVRDTDAIETRQTPVSPTASSRKLTARNLTEGSPTESSPTEGNWTKSSPEASANESATMAVTGLNHFNITASPDLIEQVKTFYRDILGFKVGPRAHLEHSGYWLYAGEAPILHLSACPEMDAKMGAEMIKSTVKCRGFFNHISLNCVGLQATTARLSATNTPYKTIELSDIAQTQVFITDPAGIGVELTFFNEAV